MPKIKYTGAADAKEFSAKDFERHGVTDQNKVVFDKSNDFTAEVSDAAWAFLSGSESGEAKVFSLSDGESPTTSDLNPGEPTADADATEPEPTETAATGRGRTR